MKLGDNRDNLFKRYFDSFRDVMKKRDRISFTLVLEYKNNVNFLAWTDTCMIKTMKPITHWLTQFQYEIIEEARMTIELIFSMPIDNMLPIHGTNSMRRSTVARIEKD